jgi:hypothetical protein
MFRPILQPLGQYTVQLVNFATAHGKVKSIEILRFRINKSQLCYCVFDLTGT